MSSLLDVYRKYPVRVTRARGCWIWDGRKRYLDMIGGIGVVALGHSNPEVVKAICNQAKLFQHVSNLFHIPAQEKLARELSQTLPDGYRIFFCNSGAEAIEGCIKFARLWENREGKGKRKFLAMKGAFHGRTAGALSGTWRKELKEPFEPLPDWFDFARDEDDALEKIRSGKYCAFFVEPIQGEAGVVEWKEGFLKSAKRECEKAECLFVVDEIQTGVGKTGKFWAFEWEDVKPDIIASAKALGGGLPLGAVILSEKVAKLVEKGMHGSTFGGNPVACSAGYVVVRKVRSERFLKKVREKGEIIRERCKELGLEVSGKGLMLGITLPLDAKRMREVERFFLDRKVIINVIGNRIRILPPLTILKEEIEVFLGVLEECARRFL